MMHGSPFLAFDQLNSASYAGRSRRINSESRPSSPDTLLAIESSIHYLCSVAVAGSFSPAQLSEEARFDQRGQAFEREERTARARIVPRYQVAHVRARLQRNEIALRQVFDLGQLAEGQSVKRLLDHRIGTRDFLVGQIVLAALEAHGGARNQRDAGIDARREMESEALEGALGRDIVHIGHVALEQALDR